MHLLYMHPVSLRVPFARDPPLELTKWCAFNFTAWLVVEDFVLAMGLLAISGSQDIGLDSTKADLVAAR
jgi:hypothetical protein